MSKAVKNVALKKEKVASATSRDMLETHLHAIRSSSTNNARYIADP